MQQFTIKTITPGKDEKSPTVIMSTDGARMSGFDKKLAALVPGTIIEVELEINGKFNNIKKWHLLQEAKSPAAPVNEYTSFFTDQQLAFLGAVYLIGTGCVEKESSLGKKTFNWLMSNIPADHLDSTGLKATQPMPRVPHAEDNGKDAGDKPFENVGQLLTWAFTTYKLIGTMVVMITGVKGAMQRRDFAEAKRLIIESQAKKQNPINLNRSGVTEKGVKPRVELSDRGRQRIEAGEKEGVLS